MANNRVDFLSHGSENCAPANDFRPAGTWENALSYLGWADCTLLSNGTTLFAEDFPGDSTEGFAFNLADPFPSQSERFADFFERAGFCVIQAKPHA